MCGPLPGLGSMRPAWRWLLQTRPEQAALLAGSAGVALLGTRHSIQTCVSPPQSNAELIYTLKGMLYTGAPLNRPPRQPAVSPATPPPRTPPYTPELPPPPCLPAELGVVRSPEVEAALRAVDRANFFPDKEQPAAYLDSAMPIGHGATISAPHMHALCLELLSDCLLRPGARILVNRGDTGTRPPAPLRPQTPWVAGRCAWLLHPAACVSKGGFPLH